MKSRALLCAAIVCLAATPVFAGAAEKTATAATKAEKAKAA